MKTIIEQDLNKIKTYGNAVTECHMILSLVLPREDVRMGLLSLVRCTSCSLNPKVASGFFDWSLPFPGHE